MASLLRMWAWLETNKKQALWGGTAVAALGLVVWFLAWRHGEQQVRAGEALSEVFVSQLISQREAGPQVAQQYLNVAARYPGYQGGAEAMLLGAAHLFMDGKYDEARADFERFVREHRRGPMETGALLGIASCLDAQHKTNEAITAYNSLINQHPNDPVTLQAKFGMARLYEGQNRLELARNIYEDLVRVRGSVISSEAGLRLQELFHQHPELAPAPPPAAVPASPSPALNVFSSSNTVPNALSNALQRASTTNAPANLLTKPVSNAPVKVLAITPTNTAQPTGKK